MVLFELLSAELRRRVRLSKRLTRVERWQPGSARYEPARFQASYDMKMP